MIVKRLYMIEFALEKLLFSDELALEWLSLKADAYGEINFEWAIMLEEVIAIMLVYQKFLLKTK